MLAGIKALTFDTGGTILDWHTGLCKAFAQAGAQHGLSADWPEITNEYRRRSLKRMVSTVNPSFNIEDVHRRVLDELIDEFELTALTADDREGIWRQWHALDTWPDFQTALMRLKTKYLVRSADYASIPTTQRGRFAIQPSHQRFESLIITLQKQIGELAMSSSYSSLMTTEPSGI